MKVNLLPKQSRFTCYSGTKTEKESLSFRHFGRARSGKPNYQYCSSSADNRYLGIGWISSHHGRCSAYGPECVYLALPNPKKWSIRLTNGSNSLYESIGAFHAGSIKLTAGHWLSFIKFRHLQAPWSSYFLGSAKTYSMQAFLLKFYEPGWNPIIGCFE